MFGASLLKVVKFGFSFTGPEIIYLLVGMLVAFVVSIFCIKFLMSYIRKHDFKVFRMVPDRTWYFDFGILCRQNIVCIILIPGSKGRGIMGQKPFDPNMIIDGRFSNG